MVEIKNEKDEKVAWHKGQYSASDVAHRAASLSARELSSWTPLLGSADSDLLDELPTLVSRSRDLIRNNGVASGAIVASQPFGLAPFRSSRLRRFAPVKRWWITLLELVFALLPAQILGCLAKPKNGLMNGHARLNLTGDVGRKTPKLT